MRQQDRLTNMVSGRNGAGSALRGANSASSWLAAALCSVLALTAASAPPAFAQQSETSRAPGAASRQDCLDPLADLASSPPLSVELFSTAPVEICTPHFQVVEIRNLSDKALGGARLMIEPPVGASLMRFLPLRPGSDARIEVSADDGATWRPAEPPTGQGIEEDPLVWSETEALPLARLGAFASPDDSVLFRWRASLGDGFGDPFGPSARLVLRGEATDACGRRVASALQSARLPLLRPELRTRLTGRNISRGGSFSDQVRAAPGDRVEWRIAVENVGDAATAAGVALLADEDGRDRGQSVLAPIRAGGRRVVTIEQTLGPSCRVQPMISEAAWGCAAPHGEPGAIGAGLGGQGRATLETSLSAADLILEQRVTDRLGADRPGALADVSVRIRNQGAPAFDPVVELALPDGFALDAAQSPQLFVESGRLLELRVVEDQPGRVRLILTGVESGQDTGRATLDSDARLEVRFGMRRARPSLLDRDDLETTLEVVDGCGASIRARPARTAVDSRRPALAVSLAPLGSPLFSHASEHARYVARIENRGDDVARAPYLLLRLGNGWGGGAIEGCRAEPGDGRDGGERVFRCDLGRDLGPSDHAELLLDFETGQSEGPTPRGPDSYRIEAEARHEGPAAPAGLERVVDRVDGVGFSLRQTLLTEAGAPRDEGKPIDLGERVIVEMDARWFAGGGAAIHDATLTQALPATLRLVRTETVDVEDWVEAESVGTLVSSGGRRIHWSIAPFEGEARFRTRLLVEAVDAAGAGRRTLRSASVEALATFRRGEAQFGVDQSLDPAAAAPSLGLVFRRPDIRLVLATSPDIEEESIATSGAASVLAPRGADATVWLGMQNAGAGPGFVDWVELTTPPGVEIAPSESDGLDNDLDGAVDEADETLFASVEALEDGRQRRRWVVLPGEVDAAPGGAAGSGRLDPGERRLWPIALRLSDALSPGDERRAMLESSIGARPLAQRAGARQRLKREVVLKAPEMTGFLVLSNIEPAAARDEQASARRLEGGDGVEFRASLALPSGPLKNLRIRAKLPPAVVDAQVRAAQVANGLDCSGGAAPVLDPGGGLVWHLGDCSADPQSLAATRLALLDFTATVVDAPGGADKETLEAWRNAAVSIGALWQDPTDGNERRTQIAETRLALVGPSLAWSIIEQPVGPLDAGDTFAFELLLRNLGDRPALDTSIRFADGLVAPEVACSALTLAGEGGGAAEGCDAALTLAGPIEPGGSRAVTLSGRLGAGIRLGRSVDLALVAGRSDVAGARTARATAALRLAPPPAPELTVERFSAGSILQEEPAARLELLPGDRLSLKADVDLPDGGVGAKVEFAVRLVSADNTPAPAEETLSGLRLLEGGDLTPAADARRAGGWLTVTLPIEPLDGAHGVDGPAPRPISKAVMLEVLDASAIRAGRRIEMVAALRAGGRSRAAVARRAVIVEPFVDLAARAPNDGRDRVEARVCNRGGAAAYGVALRLKAGSLGRISGVRLLTAETSALNSTGVEPLSLGTVTRDAAGSVHIDSGATPLPPEACLVLDADVERRAGTGLRQSVLEGERRVETVAVTLVGFRSSASELGGGRQYASDQSVTVEMPPRSLAIAGPARAYAGGGGHADQAGVFSAPFSISFPASFGAARLSVEARSAPGLVWTLWRDLDADGLRDADEPRWEDGGAAMAGDAPIAFIAQADLPRTGQSGGWRGHLHLRGLGISDDGFAAAGAMTVALLPSGNAEAVIDRVPDERDVPPLSANEALAGLAARRLMAVDRDCDGDRGDELGQDALFEDSKLAAPGECVIMRLEFENTGRRAVESVAIEDRPPEASRFIQRSARFAETPGGLISGAIHEPPVRAEDDNLVRFDFFGVLGPGQSGAVEYSVRLTDG